MIVARSLSVSLCILLLLVIGCIGGDGHDDDFSSLNESVGRRGEHPTSPTYVASTYILHSCKDPTTCNEKSALT